MVRLNFRSIGPGLIGPGHVFLSAAVIAAVVLMAGCVQLTEAQRDARDYRRVDYQARFLDFRRACHGEGKRIVIHSYARVSRDGVPTPGDRYFCASRHY